MIPRYLPQSIPDFFITSAVLDNRSQQSISGVCLEWMFVGREWQLLEGLNQLRLLSSISYYEPSIWLFILVFQMNAIYRILLLSSLATILTAQLIGSGNHCLGNCANCQNRSLFSCTGSNPCEEGFYYSPTQGTCQIVPSLELSNHKFGKQAKGQNAVLSWDSGLQSTNCTYEHNGIKQPVEILGLFKGEKKVQKQFQVPNGKRLVEIRFSFIYNDWMPFGDYLALEIHTGDQLLKTYQISFEQRRDISTHWVKFICNRSEHFIERYRLIIQPQVLKNVKNETIKLVFNSLLLDDSAWGITEVKLITGCVGLTRYDQRTGQCNSCDSGYYLVPYGSNSGICKTCSELCTNCNTQHSCTKCRWGDLINGKCQIPQAYKSQQLTKDYFSSTCGPYSLLMSSKSNKIVIPPFENAQNYLYDEVIPVVVAYYDPFEVNLKTKKPVEITLQVNGQDVKSVDLKKENLELVENCYLFASQRMAKITFVGPPTPLNDYKISVSLTATGIHMFGVSKVGVFSLRKKPVQQKQPLEQKLPFEQKQPQVIVKTVDPAAQVAPPQTISIITSTLPLQVRLQPQTQTQPQQSQQSQQPSPDKNSPLLLEAGQANKSNSSDNIAPLNLSLKPKIMAPLSQKTNAMTSNNGSLLFSILGVNHSVNGKVVVQIDQLQPSDYQLLETYYFDDNLIVEVQVNKSFTKGKVSFKQIVLTARLLQASQQRLISSTIVERYDAVSQSELHSFAFLEKAFQGFAWFGILAIIITVISGFGVVIEEYIVTLQLTYLHIYIGFSLLPISFTHTVSGLRGVTLLDFFNPFAVTTSPWSINSQMLFKLAPISYNFFYAFLPILLTLVSYALWFLALIAVKKWLLPRDIPDQSRGTLHKIIDGVVCRVINYIDTIWRYQFIAIVLISMKEFFTFKEDFDSSQLAFAGSVLFLYLCWSAFSEYYVREQYYQCEYSYFLFKFEDRFFCRIPQHSLPSRHHRLGYPLVRMAKALIFVLFTFFSQPVVALSFMILINSFELWYVFSNFIYSDSRMLKFKLVEGILFVALQIVMLVLVLAHKQISSGQFIGWGLFLAALAILSVINGLARVVFSGWLKYMQMKDVNFEEVELDQKKLQTQRAV